MYIRELRVDGYGALHDVSVAFDRPLTVVLGPNEAGKSTLLRFVRSMLYGFPTRKDPVERGEPVSGGRHGGTVYIRTAEGRELLLSRYAEGRAQGTLTVREADGTPLPWPQPMLEKMVLGGVSERLFRQLFAITLDELHELLTLQGEEIGNYLYQSGLAGGKLLAEARRHLAAEMDKLHRPRGSAQEINRVLVQIRELEERMRQGRTSLAEYQDKSRELERVGRRLGEIEQDLPRLAAEEARWRSALACREWWLKDRLLLAEARELSSQLTSPEAPVLSEEDQHAWEALQRRREEAAARHEQAKRELARIRTERDALQWDGTLLAHAEALERLEVKRAALAARQEEMLAVRAELEQAADQAAAAAARIGADWTAGDLAALAPIATEREPLRRLQQELAEASGTLRHLEAEGERLQRQREALKAQQGPGGREGTSGGRRKEKGTGWGLMAASAATAACVLLLAGAAWGMLPKLAVPVLAAAAAISFVAAVILGVRQIGRRERAKALAEAGRHQLAQLEEERAALEAAREREAERVRRLRGEWDAWCRRYNLPESLTPDSLPDLFVTAEEGLTALRRLDRARQREAGLARELEQFHEEAANLFAACPPPASLQEDVALAVSWLHSRLKEQLATKTEAAKLDAAVRSAESAEQGAREALLQAEDEIVRRIAAAGEEDEAAYARRLRIDARRRELQRERRELALRLEAGRTPDQVSEMIALLENHDEAALAEKLLQAEEALALARGEHAALLEQKGRLSQELRQLSQEAEQEDARVRLSEAESRLQELAERYAVLALGDRLLQKTKAIYEAERQPEVLRRASHMFSRMTGGAYIRIIIPPDTMQVMAETKDRRVIDSAFLSRGTQEQLYLAMRFALAETVSPETPLPLMLDDLFVHFDRQRLQNTLPVLEDISGRRQVILLTCHHHVAETICRSLPSAGMVPLVGRAAGPAVSGPGSSDTAR